MSSGDTGGNQNEIGQTNANPRSHRQQHRQTTNEIICLTSAITRTQLSSAHARYGRGGPAEDDGWVEDRWHWQSLWLEFLGLYLETNKVVRTLLNCLPWSHARGGGGAANCQQQQQLSRPFVLFDWCCLPIGALWRVCSPFSRFHWLMMAVGSYHVSFLILRIGFSWSEWICWLTLSLWQEVGQRDLLKMSFLVMFDTFLCPHISKGSHHRDYHPSSTLNYSLHGPGASSSWSVLRPSLHKWLIEKSIFLSQGYLLNRWAHHMGVCEFMKIHVRSHGGQRWMLYFVLLSVPVANNHQLLVDDHVDHFDDVQGLIWPTQFQVSREDFDIHVESWRYANLFQLQSKIF
jgi:hypothetical protein